MRLSRYSILYIVGTLQIIWLIFFFRQHIKQLFKHRYYGILEQSTQMDKSSQHKNGNIIKEDATKPPREDVASSYNTERYLNKDDRKMDLHGNFTVHSTGLKSEHTDMKDDAIEFNTDIVVYNRLAKCGSTTLMRMVENYSNVTYKNDHNRSTFSFKEPDIVELVQSLHTPAFYVRHCKFINFTEYGFKQPLFIQIVRDPIKRAISHFYYTKWHFHLIGEHMTLDDCLQLQIKQNTSFNHCNVVAKFSWRSFCTDSVLNEDRCTIAHVKTIMEKYYVFIGIMEHYEESIEALSKLLPHLFPSNVTIEPKNSAIESTKHENPEPSANALGLLRRELASEYIVYDFAKQLFHDKLKKLNINISSKDK